MTAETKGKRSRRLTRRFYAEALSEAERLLLPEARGIEGVEEEIALLRLRLRAVLQETPLDLPLLLHGVEVLARVVGAQHKLPKRERERLDASVRSLRDEMQALFAAGGQGAGDEV